MFLVITNQQSHDHREKAPSQSSEVSIENSNLIANPIRGRLPCNDQHPKNIDSSVIHCKQVARDHHRLEALFREYIELNALSLDELSKRILDDALSLLSRKSPFMSFDDIVQDMVNVNADAHWVVALIVYFQIQPVDLDFKQHQYETLMKALKDTLKSVNLRSWGIPDLVVARQRKCLNLMMQDSNLVLPLSLCWVMDPSKAYIKGFF